MSETRRIKYGRKIVQYTKNGELIASFESIIEASEKEKNVSACSIGNVLNGRAKTAGGFIWKYNEPKEVSSKE